MQLLVAVKQGKTGIVGNEIDLGFLVSPTITTSLVYA
jgi:hypothetical protein